MIRGGVAPKSAALELRSLRISTQRLGGGPVGPPALSAGPPLPLVVPATLDSLAPPAAPYAYTLASETSAKVGCTFHVPSNAKMPQSPVAASLAAAAPSLRSPSSA